MKTLIFSFLFVITAGFAIAQNTEQPSVVTVSYTTSAVCGMCEEKVEAALFKVKGVVHADLDPATKVVTIQYRPKKTTEQALIAAINNMGYDAGDHKANPDSYNQLPDCCRKEIAPH